MVFGINIANLFGKRKKRVMELLEESEKLSAEGLKREEALAILFKYFNEFLQESKQEKIENELRKEYKDVQSKEVLLPYFKKVYFLLRKIGKILGLMGKFNKRLLGNAEELKLLVEERNKGWRIIPLDERKFFLEFQNLCNKRYEELSAIDILLSRAYGSIDRMSRTIELELRDIENFDTRRVVECINSEKQLFLEIAKAQLKKLGFEVESLEEILELEGLNQAVFDKEFLNNAKQGTKIVKWNKRIRRIAATYIFLFYAGFQIVLPAYFTSMQIDAATVNTFHQDVYKRIQQNSQNIRFKSYDGIELSGILIKNNRNMPTNKAMILVHGRSANATWLLPYAEKLRMLNEGLDFFSINLRNHGPDRPDEWLRSTTIGLKEALDVVGAINELAARGYTEVIVYGHSMGGAAVINALGKHQNLLSKDIAVKGAIVEKTFANLHDFLWRSHKILSSNLGYNAYAAFSGEKEYSKQQVMRPSNAQSYLSENLIERLSSFNTAENNPAQAIRNINAPVMVIGVKEGDCFMTKNDADELTKNAKYGIEVLVSRPNDSLVDRHRPEFNNSAVIGDMVNFINQVMQTGRNMPI